MASKSQPGVILYFDDFRCELKYLSMEQRGKLFTAVLDYAEYGVAPEDGDLDPVGDCCFNRVAKKIDRNAQAYRETCEKRKKAIEKRWNDAGAYNSISEDTSEYSCIQMNATETETETEEKAKRKTEKETETEPVNEAETVKEKQGGAPIGNRNARKFPLQENDLKTTLKQPDKETDVEREKEVESEADEEKKEAPPKLCFGEKVIEEETEKEKKAAAVLGFDPFAIARNALYGDRSVPSSPETDMETRKQEQIAAVLGWRS